MVFGEVRRAVKAGLERHAQYNEQNSAAAAVGRGQSAATSAALRIRLSSSFAASVAPHSLVTGHLLLQIYFKPHRRLSRFALCRRSRILP
jgi:hypothetical protein